MDHERAPLARVDGTDQLIEHVALAAAPKQHLVTESTPLSTVRQVQLPPGSAVSFAPPPRRSPRVRRFEAGCATRTLSAGLLPNSRITIYPDSAHGLRA